MGHRNFFSFDSVDNWKVLIRQLVITEWSLLLYWGWIQLYQIITCPGQITKTISNSDQIAAFRESMHTESHLERKSCRRYKKYPSRIYEISMLDATLIMLKQRMSFTITASYSFHFWLYLGNKNRRVQVHKTINVIWKCIWSTDSI